MDILGIGECMIELYAPQSLASAATFTRHVGGDVYNTLVSAQQSGCQTAFLSRIALDGFGQVLFHHMAKEGIDARYVQGVKTGFNGIYFATQQRNTHHFTYYRAGSVASQLTPKHVHPQVVQQAKVLYVSGISQGISQSARSAVLKACQMAKQSRITVAYDPNYRAALWPSRHEAMDALVELLPYVDVLLPSFEDIRGLLDIRDRAHMMEYFRLRAIPLVVLKQGAQGATLGFQRAEKHFDAPAVSEIQDTIGAGDAFNGGFLAGLVQQKSLSACVEQGLKASARCLQTIGPIR